MTSFTFSSEDLERVNKDKKQADKIFPEVENFRNARGLQTNGQVDKSKIDALFSKDAKRCGTVTWKNENNTSESVIGVEFSKSSKNEQNKNSTEKITEFLKEKKLSEQQIQDCKSLSTQETVISGGMMLYAASIPTLQETAVMNLQSDPGIPVQFKLNDKQELICSTTSKLIFDKSRTSYNFDSYNKGTSDDIKTSDYIIATSEINLGKVGATNYKPTTVCYLYAEGKNSEALLENIQNNIGSSLLSRSNSKSPESIKEEHHKLQSEIFEVTGARTLHEELVKDDIKMLLESKSPKLRGSVQMLHALESTPTLFTEVLVERISEINKIKDDKERSQAMKQLSDKSQVFFDHHHNTSKLVENLSSSLQLNNKKQHNTVKSSFTALINDTLNDLKMKNDIATLLNQEPDRLYSINVEALRQNKSTPKLFAEVLVDRISEINKIKDDKERSQAIKQLSDNAANFVDQPKGYMEILINDTAKEMAKAQNINLPKEGIISKISSNIKLMLAKMNVKIHGKSKEVEKTKLLIIEARTKRQNSGHAR